MLNPSKLFDNFKNTVLTKFGPNPANMLIWTGVLGWFLSSTAQVVAIAVNEKIPKEQKMFLIPQEIGDGAINVLSFLLVTSSIKSLTSKLVSTGKLATPEIRAFLKKTGLHSGNGLGNVKFDISKMANFDQIKDEYRSFKNGVDVIGMTAGSILSCNIITPILRNKFATNRKQKMLANDKIKQESIKAPRGISMDAYMKQASLKYSSSSLKI
ncbi:hypothetical protein IJZ97_03830 [bacterium]|nr:hypothetical protein [bacterium]